MSTSAMLRTFIGGDAPTGRDATVDVIRGLCIVSMVFAHVARGGVGHQITHFAIWYDGAMGFVLLSGLVVGMVHRKTVDRQGPRAEMRKAWKRARLVYIAHISLCVLGFVIAALFPAQDQVYASLADVGGWGHAAIDTLLLQINPPKASILSLYVILLLLTPLACALLSRNLWWVLIIASVLVWGVGNKLDAYATLPRQPGEFGEINVAAWQPIYFIALIGGWYWPQIRVLITRPLVWGAAAAVTTAVVTYAHLVEGPDRPSFVPWLFRSGQMGIGTIGLAFAVIVTMFPIIGWLDRKVPLITGLSARVGRRSLDCYIILAFIVLIWQSVAPYERSTWIGDTGACVALAVMWGWSRLRDHRKASKTLPTSAPVQVGAY